MEAVAAEIGATGAAVDVGSEPELTAFIAELQRGGPIDLFCSNAGINGAVAGPRSPTRSGNASGGST